MHTLTRRDLLKFMGAGACLAALPASSHGAEGKAPAATPTRKANSAVYRFPIGDFEAVSITAGAWEMPNPHGMFAPQASPEQFRQALDEEYLPADKVRLHFNVLLVRTGKENILIDAGFGGETAPHFDLTANLAEVGVKPSDISTVFLSHAHGDHMGGLLDAQGKPVFSKAEHFCSAEEQGFWTSAKPDFSTSRSDEKTRSGGIAAARRTFDGIKFTTLKPGTKVPEGVTPLLAAGHTPGHLNFLFESKGQKMHHIVDLAHHFAIMMPHPDWTVGFDINESMAAATRKATFARLAAEGTPTFGYHLPFPALGRIKTRGDGFRWVPSTWEPGV